jgi:hypothetical protein
MENINTQLKKKIMRRVYFTYYLRKVFSPLAIKAYLLISFVGFISSQVSFANIMANMPSITNISALYHFYTSAFLNTGFIVQLLSVGMLLAIFLLLKDIVKTYAPHTLTTA